MLMWWNDNILGMLVYRSYNPTLISTVPFYFLTGISGHFNFCMLKGILEVSVKCIIGSFSSKIG